MGGGVVRCGSNAESGPRSLTQAGHLSLPGGSGVSVHCVPLSCISTRAVSWSHRLPRTS